MSHEVRTPLNGILRTMRSGRDAARPRAAGVREVIRSSAAAFLGGQRHPRRVEVEAGMMTVESPLDLRAAFREEVVSLCGQLAAARGVGFALDYDPPARRCSSATAAPPAGDAQPRLQRDPLHARGLGAARRARAGASRASALSSRWFTGRRHRGRQAGVRVREVHPGRPGARRGASGDGPPQGWRSPALVELMGGSLTVASEQAAVRPSPRASRSRTQRRPRRRSLAAGARGGRSPVRPTCSWWRTTPPTSACVAVASASSGGDGGGGAAWGRGRGPRDGRFDVVPMDHHYARRWTARGHPRSACSGTPAASLPSSLALTASAMRPTAPACCRGMTRATSKLHGPRLRSLRIAARRGFRLTLARRAAPAVVIPRAVIDLALPAHYRILPN